MLDLSQPRDLNELLSATFSLYRRHYRVFPVIALAVVVPLDLITVGLIDGNLTSGYDSDNVLGGGVAYSIVSTLVTTPLITAGHVTAVMDIGRREQPSVGRSLQGASLALPTLMATVVLYVMAVFAGLIALIIPGIYVGVRLYFSPQAVVAEGNGAFDALRRSWALVEGSWWRVLGIALLMSILAGLLAAVLGAPVAAAAAAADSGPLLLVGTMVVDAVSLSLVALGGTLLFFDLRTRREFRVTGAAPPPPAPLDRPEAPSGG